MNKAPRIYVTGKDVWALGTEDRLARESLSTFAKVVNSVHEADFIHTVDVEETAAKIYRGELVPTKPIVGAINNHPTRLVEWPGFIHVAQRCMHLVPQSTLAAEDMKRLGLVYHGKVRIATDAESYARIDSHDPELIEFRDKLGLPENVYVIGLFQRDTEGRDLTVLKRQKGPDIFLAIMAQLKKRVGTNKFHVLLGGPRRHWIRRALENHDIPYTFVGEVIEGDDYPENILDKRTMRLLYNLLDLYIIPTRWEGAPRQIFDMSECGRKIISTPVGIVPDILARECVFDTIDKAVDLITKDLETGFLQQFVEESRKKINDYHSIREVGSLWNGVYQQLTQQRLSTSSQEISPDILSRAKRGASAALYPFLFFLFYRTRLAALRKTCFPLKATFITDSKQNESLIRHLEDKLTGLHVVITHEPHLSNTVILMGSLELLSSGNDGIKGKKIIFILNGDILRGVLQADAKQRKNLAACLSKADTTVLTSDIYLSWLMKEGIYLNNPVVLRLPPDPEIFYPDTVVNNDKTHDINALVIIDTDDQAYENYLAVLESDETISCTILELSEDHADRFAARVEADIQKRAQMARQNDFAVLLTSRLTFEEIIELQACGLPCIYPNESENVQRLVGMSGISFKHLEEFNTAVQNIKKYLFAYRMIITTPRLDDAALTLKEIIRRPKARA